MGKVQILLRQHVGAPCAPCVEVGADVKKGTLIATPTGLGANIYASVYGKVTEITDDRIIIEAADERCAGRCKQTGYGKSSRSSWNGRSWIPDRS